MTIAKIARDSVEYVAENDTIKNAAMLMQEKHVGCLLVKHGSNGRQEEPVGMVTDRDIVIKAVAKGLDINTTPVKDIMSEHLLSISQHHGVRETIQAMATEGVRRAPLTDEKNHVCGIVSMDDILLLFASEMNELANLVKEQCKDRH
jgi:CBS domain-containing protein